MDNISSVLASQRLEACQSLSQGTPDFVTRMHRILEAWRQGGEERGRSFKASCLSAAQLLREAWDQALTVDGLVRERLESPEALTHAEEAVCNEWEQCVWKETLVAFEMEIANKLRSDILALSVQGAHHASERLLEVVGRVFELEGRLGEWYVSVGFSEESRFRLNECREGLFEEALKLYTRLYPEAEKGDLLLQLAVGSACVAFREWTAIYFLQWGRLQEACAMPHAWDALHHRLIYESDFNACHRLGAEVMAAITSVNEELARSGPEGLDPRMARLRGELAVLEERTRYRWMDLFIERIEQVCCDCHNLMEEEPVPKKPWTSLCRELRQEGKRLLPELEKLVVVDSALLSRWDRELKSYLSEMKEALETSSSAYTSSDTSSASPAPVALQQHQRNPPPSGERSSPMRSYAIRAGAILAAIVIVLAAISAIAALSTKLQKRPV